MAMGENFSRLESLIPKSLRTRLEDYCQRRGMSQSQAVRDALEVMLDLEEQAQQLSAGDVRMLMKVLRSG